MGEFPSEVLEFVRKDLVWLAEFLMEKYGLSIGEIRSILAEMLTVSV